MVNVTLRTTKVGVTLQTTKVEVPLPGESALAADARASRVRAEAAVLACQAILDEMIALAGGGSPIPILLRDGSALVDRGGTPILHR
jgi:hypothetical protein